MAATKNLPIEQNARQFSVGQYLQSSYYYLFSSWLSFAIKTCFVIQTDIDGIMWYTWRFFPKGKKATWKLVPITIRHQYNFILNLFHFIKTRVEIPHRLRNAIDTKFLIIACRNFLNTKFVSCIIPKLCKIYRHTRMFPFNFDCLISVAGNFSRFRCLRMQILIQDGVSHMIANKEHFFCFARNRLW